ncbi:MAG: AMP-binding protein, partial [Acidobacteriaceae bacterium]
MTILFDGTITDSSTAPNDVGRLVEWNSTEVEFDAHKRIHDLFDEQALRTPEKTAVICRDRALTYESLAERVQQLAGRLRELGVGAE